MHVRVLETGDDRHAGGVDDLCARPDVRCHEAIPADSHVDRSLSPDVGAGDDDVGGHGFQLTTAGGVIHRLGRVTRSST